LCNTIASITIIAVDTSFCEPEPSSVLKLQLEEARLSVSSFLLDLELEDDDDD
jgi:hypothetical protein